MILNHIADCAGLIIERASALNSKVLRHSNLYALDLIAVPERFQNRILEAEEDHVVHRPLSQVMVDAEDVLLIEGAEQDPIKLLCGGEVVTEGFFNDDASAVGVVCFGHADDRHIKVAAFYHRLKCRKNILVSKIPGSTEKDQRI